MRSNTEILRDSDRLNPHAISKLRRRAAEAFTLVETVIAIGIVSTVMVALVGMMPEGVKMMNQSGQRTVGARIAQEILGRIQLGTFAEVSDFEKDLYYFDDQGTSVPAADLSIVYTAQVEVDTRRIYLPGADRTSYLKNVTVKVSDNPGVPNFSDAHEPRDFLRYSTMIVDTTEDRN